MTTGPIWLFPAASFFLLPTGFLISYAIGVSRFDIEPFWPYVSDTGAEPPESCIFGQLLNMSAFLMMISLYLRHRHVMAYFKATRHLRKKIILSSRLFLVVGLIASFGLTLVANFQEDTVSAVHFTGAIIAFVLGLVYAWYQGILSYISPRDLTPLWLAILRLLICIFGTIFFIGLFARSAVGQQTPLDPAYIAGKYNGTSIPSVFYRGPGDPGYTAFLITTISEWSLAFSLALFFFTLTFDLYDARVHPPKLNLKLIEMHPGYSDTKRVSVILNDDGAVPLPGLISHGNIQENKANHHSDMIISGDNHRPRGLRRTYDFVMVNDTQ